MYECKVGDVYILRSDGSVDGFSHSVDKRAGGHQGHLGRGQQFRVPGFIDD